MHHNKMGLGVGERLTALDVLRKYPPHSWVRSVITGVRTPKVGAETTQPMDRMIPLWMTFP